MNTKAIINIGKKQLGMNEDDYRSFLKLVTGKDSLRSMTEAERVKVVKAMEKRGFKKQKKKTPFSDKKYVRFIFALWKSCHELDVVQDGSRKALCAFVRNETEKHGQKIDAPEWLTEEQATPIIDTLKSMENRGLRKKK